MHSTTIPGIASAALLTYAGGLTTHDDSSTGSPITELVHTTIAAITPPSEPLDDSAAGTVASGPTIPATAGTDGRWTRNVRCRWLKLSAE